MLTPQQKKLLVFVHNYIQTRGISPSFDEMFRGLELKSKSGVHRLLDQLVERGFVRRLKNRARAIEVIRLPEDMPQLDPQPARFDIFQGIKIVCTPGIPDDEIWVSHAGGANLQRFKVA